MSFCLKRVKIQGLRGMNMLEWKGREGWYQLEGGKELTQTGEQRHG